MEYSLPHVFLNPFNFTLLHFITDALQRMLLLSYNNVQEELRQKR